MEEEYYEEVETETDEDLTAGDVFFRYRYCSCRLSCCSFNFYTYQTYI